MNRGISIVDDIFWVGENDDQTNLFENIWPLPRGVSYNAYLIRDDKNVLIDACHELGTHLAAVTQAENAPT